MSILTSGISMQYQAVSADRRPEFRCEDGTTCLFGGFIFELCTYHEQRRGCPGSWPQSFDGYASVAGCTETTVSNAVQEEHAQSRYR